MFRHWIFRIYAFQFGLNRVNERPVGHLQQSRDCSERCCEERETDGHNDFEGDFSGFIKVSLLSEGPERRVSDFLFLIGFGLIEEVFEVFHHNFRQL